ncbi:MAG: hypothetical protein ABIJ61_05740 [bacterium]
MKLLHKITRACCYSFLLALPVGIYQGDPDSVDYQLGVHAGGGQVASVLTSCSEPVEAEGSGFVDFAGEAYMKFPPGGDLPFVVGVRGGYWHSNLSLIDWGDHWSGGDYIITQHDLSVGYLNPCISFETHYAGIGIGYVFGDLPRDFSEGEIYYVGHTSMHVRIGSARAWSITYSMLESAPYVSGGGYPSVALAFPLGKKVRSSVGISFEPYYRPGFLQQNRIQINENLAIDFNWRYGTSADVPEYGVSAGVVYQFRSR